LIVRKIGELAAAATWLARGLADAVNTANGEMLSHFAIGA
jgi:hypothetical protein